MQVAAAGAASMPWISQADDTGSSSPRPYIHCDFELFAIFVTIVFSGPSHVVLFLTPE